MGKRSRTSAHRDQVDEEEIAKEAEREGREGEGRGGERRYLASPQKKGRRRH